GGAGVLACPTYARKLSWVRRTGMAQLGFLIALLGGGAKQPPALATANLAGFFLAHAVWSVSDGGPLVPVVATERGGKRAMQRFVADRLEVAQQQAQHALDDNPGHADRAVMVFDGYVRGGGRRVDALIAVAVDYQAGVRLEIELLYRPADT